MNVHYCPMCGRGFFCRGELGETVKLPKHTAPQRLRDKVARLPGMPCIGTRQAATTVRPPGIGAR